MFFYPTDEPRNERTQETYVWELIAEACGRAIDNGIFSSSEDFFGALGLPVFKAVHSDGLTGEELFEMAGAEGIPIDLLGTTDSKAIAPALAVAFCAQAYVASLRGEVTAAWTFLIDARLSVDGIGGVMLSKGDERRIRSATARNAVAAKLANDPVQAAKAEMRKEWERWQADRSLYAKPALFRAKMLWAHRGIVPDGTLKNWMTEWRKEWKPSSC